MRLGEQSAFFIKKSHYSSSFCQSAVMSNVCFCPKIFGPITESKCVCKSTIVFVVTLVGIDNKLSLSQIEPFFLQEVSPRYLLRQIQIAKYYLEELKDFERAEYIFQYVMCHMLGLEKIYETLPK